MPLLLSYCGRLRYIHALEVVPYGKSPVERARVKAARAAQRDDAADPANLRCPHTDQRRRKVLITAARISTPPAALLARRGPTCFVRRQERLCCRQNQGAGATGFARIARQLGLHEVQRGPPSRSTAMNEGAAQITSEMIPQRTTERPNVLLWHGRWTKAPRPIVPRAYSRRLVRESQRP